MSKLIRHVIFKKPFTVTPLQLRTLTTMFREFNNRQESSPIKNSLLKCLHTSRPTLKYSEKLKTLKEYSKDYWYALAPIYIANNAVWFLICEYVIYQEFDVITLLRQLQIGDAILDFLTSHFIGKHALSLLLFKILTPLRFLTMYRSSKTIIGYISKNNLLPPKPFNIWKKPKK